MIVYDLNQTGLKLKSELQNNCSPEMAKRIALEIEQAIHADGTPLTKVEKGHLVKYIEFPVYDHKTGQAVLHEADNSEFLELVAIVAQNIKGDKQSNGNSINYNSSTRSVSKYCFTRKK